MITAQYKKSDFEFQADKILIHAAKDAIPTTEGVEAFCDLAGEEISLSFLRKEYNHEQWTEIVDMTLAKLKEEQARTIKDL